MKEFLLAFLNFLEEVFRITTFLIVFVPLWLIVKFYIVLDLPDASATLTGAKHLLISSNWFEGGFIIGSRLNLFELAQVTTLIAQKKEQIIFKSSYPISYNALLNIWFFAIGCVIFIQIKNLGSWLVRNFGHRE